MDRTMRISRRVETYKFLNGKSIVGVWIVDRKLCDVVASDGTCYTLDYGLVRVLVDHKFPSRQRSNSKLVLETVARLERLKHTFN